jgi:hypothetical protein
MSRVDSQMSKDVYVEIGVHVTHSGADRANYRYSHTVLSPSRMAVNGSDPERWNQVDRHTA